MPVSVISRLVMSKPNPSSKGICASIFIARGTGNGAVSRSVAAGFPQRNNLRDRARVRVFNIT